MEEDDAPTKTWLRQAVTLLAGAGIVLVLINAALLLRNQKAQAVVNQRQQAINQSAVFSRASQLLIQTIARTAVTNKDDALMALLERHGIRVNTDTPQPAPAKP